MFVCCDVATATIKSSKKKMTRFESNERKPTQITGQKTGKKSIRFAFHLCSFVVFFCELIPSPHIAHCTVQVIDH